VNRFVIKGVFGVTVLSGALTIFSVLNAEFSGDSFNPGLNRAEAAPKPSSSEMKSQMLADSALEGVSEDDIDAKSLRDMYKQLSSLERQVMNIGSKPGTISVAVAPTPVAPKVTNVVTNIVPEKIEKELKSLKAALAEKEAVVLELQKQMEVLRAKAAAQPTEVIKEVVKIVETEAMPDKTVLTKMNAEWETKHEQLVTELIRTRKKERALQAQLSDFRLKVQDLETKIASGKKQQAVMTEQVAALSLEVKQKQKLQSEKLRTEQELLDARKTIQGYQGEIERKRIVEADNVYLREELDRQREKVVAFEELQSERDKYSKDLTSSKNWVDKLSKENSKLESMYNTNKSDAQKLQAELKKIKTQTEQLAETSTLKDKEIQSLSGDLKASKKSIAQLQAELQSTKEVAAKVPALQKKLVRTQNKLLMQQAEEELDPENAGVKASSAAAAIPEQAARASMNQPQDLKIVMVNVNKGKLRAGPGAEHSPVMEIAKGGRLSVEAEEGDWYRVFTPRGTRAYIHKSIVLPWSANAKGNQQVNTKAASNIAGTGKLIGKAPVDNDEPEVSELTEEQAAFESLRRGMGAGK